MKLKLRLRWWQFWQWLDGQLPVQCARCGRWHARKNSIEAQTTWNQWLKICPGCYRELYGEPDEGEQL